MKYTFSEQGRSNRDTQQQRSTRPPGPYFSATDHNIIKHDSVSLKEIEVNTLSSR